MLEDDEFALLVRVFDEMTVPIGAFAMQENPDRDVIGALGSARNQRILDEHERLTGSRENGGNFWHHRRGAFGPPCPKCGKLLRTPRASKCMECGTPRSV